MSDLRPSSFTSRPRCSTFSRIGCAMLITVATSICPSCIYRNRAHVSDCVLLVYTRKRQMFGYVQICLIFCVCMYVCMYVCMQVWMYLRMCVVRGSLSPRYGAFSGHLPSNITTRVTYTLDKFSSNALVPPAKCAVSPPPPPFFLFFLTEGFKLNDCCCLKSSHQFYLFFGCLSASLFWFLWSHTICVCQHTVFFDSLGDEAWDRTETRRILNVTTWNVFRIKVLAGVVLHSVGHIKDSFLSTVTY